MNATLIDVFTTGRLVNLWLRDREGQNFFLKDYITPSFFVGGTQEELAQAEKIIEQKFAYDCSASFALKKEFETNRYIQVLEVIVKNVKAQHAIIRAIEKEFNFMLNFYNSDIELDRFYLFTKNIRPLQEVDFGVQGEWAKNIKPQKFTSFTEHYPKLKTFLVEAIPAGEAINKNTKISSLRLGNEYFHGKEKEILERFKKAFEGLDPDVIMTTNGNKYEFDLVKQRMSAHGIKFEFGRFSDEFTQKEGKSYFSYGRVIRHEPARYLRGRLHIQINDFHYSECGLDGIYEIAHSTVIPIQKAARLGSGNCISNLQFYIAFQKGFLIPVKKNQVERFNSGWHLFEADKGGMVYEPISGLHENVIEIDFSSLYPSIMVYHNISPETVLCSCCNNQQVPGLGYNVCEKRRGLIPEVLEPILKKRLYYKHMKEMTEGREKDRYTAMSNALKWLLVVSFGYTGFKNARFGRIEAHQSICAYAREKLLQAAHLAEDQGFEIVHGIVDALYIKKNGAIAQEIQGLVNKIIEATGVEIVVEGTFKWIVFLPRMSNPEISTPTRFYGQYTNGEYKVRGVQLRRSDTPPAIKQMQNEQLRVMGKANNEKEFRQKIPQVLTNLKEWTTKLQNNMIPPEELAIRIDVTKKAEDYRANVAQKAALIQLAKRGIQVNEGEPIHFIYSNFRAKKFENRIQILPNRHPRIDTQKYEELFVRATYELLNFLKEEKHALELAAQNTVQTSLTEWVKVEETILT